MMLETNIKMISPPIGELIYDLENYCRQEGLDSLLILSVLKNEVKERKPMRSWRERINLTKEWVKQAVKIKEENDSAAGMDNQKIEG